MNRLFNWQGEMRIDTPHLRAQESSIVANFDLLAGGIMAEGAPYVVSGFKLVGTVALQAEALQLTTAGGILLHSTASEFGTLFSVPTDRAPEILFNNARVRGSFTANSVNYIGIDLVRAPDSTTSDLTQFLDLTTNTETPKTIPLGRTLDYVVVISTNNFTATPNICPIAKVTTSASNVVLVIEDARYKFFRLGTGGSAPDIYHAYNWPALRSEPLSGSSFTDGDKGIDSQKSWMDAIMTRLWELGGGEHWYSPTADRNVKMVRTGAAFTNGEYFEWVAGNLHWQGLSFVFDNSTGYINTVTDQTIDAGNLTDLLDGECIYVDIDRTTNATLQPFKVAYQLLGTPTVPGSRQIIAWRIGASIFTRDGAWPVGSSFNVATPAALGVVKLNVTSPTPLAPVVPIVNAGGVVVGEGLTRATSGVLVIGGPGGLNTGTAIGDVDAFGNIVYNTLYVVGQDGVIPRFKPKFQALDTIVTRKGWSIDHNGFPMGGRITVLDENWVWGDQSPAESFALDGAFINGNKWRIWTTVPASGKYSVDVDYFLGCPAFTLYSSVTMGHQQSVNTSQPVVIGPGGMSSRTGVTIVAEWELALERIQNQVWLVGFFDNSSDPGISTNAKLWVSTQNGGNWKFSVLGHADVDTGVAPSVTTGGPPTYFVSTRFRIEAHGSSTPIGIANGGTNTCLCFIDDVLRATVLSSPFNSSGLAYFGMEVFNNGMALLPCMGKLSPIKICINRWDSSPDL